MITIIIRWPIPVIAGLRRRTAATRLLRLRVRIPPGTCLSVCSASCVSSGASLSHGPIPRRDESYRACRMPLRVIRGNKKPLQLQSVGTRGQSKKKVVISQSLVLQFSEVSVLNHSWKHSCGYQMFISILFGNGSPINIADIISKLLMVNLISFSKASSYLL